MKSSFLEKTLRIPLGQKTPCETKSLRDYITLRQEIRASAEVTRKITY